MNKRLASVVIALAAGAAAAGLLANPSNSASGECPKPPPGTGGGCLISLTATGPSPSTVRMAALWHVGFQNVDSVTHTVVFANGHCTVTLSAGEPARWLDCSNFNLVSYAGSHAYTVDGKFTGTVVTAPLHRSVSLTARTHVMRAGARLTLHGQVWRSNTGRAPPPPVVVLARHNSKQPFEPLATVRTRGSHQAVYGWKLDVQPDVTTTYIAEVTAQRICYYPASGCAHPQGQVWTNASSRPFRIRIRH